MSAQTTSYIPLSLHEDYAPAWKVWEGVRELVQNCHDGALSSAAASRCEWSAAAEHVFVCSLQGGAAANQDGPMAKICYLPELQRLVLINRHTGLQRKVLLLGASQKDDSCGQAIGQFGEGMKVGTLALLREGRRVEMSTRGEHWQWTRRVDDRFGARVLTVAVSAHTDDPLSPIDVDDGASGDGVTSRGLHRRLGPDDTVTWIEPLTASEWDGYCIRFLFLRPPASSFE